MLKRFCPILIFLSCLLLASQVSANTVEFRFENIGDLEVSGFQLFFFEPDGTYGYPVDTNYATFEMDFDFEWGDAQTRDSFWSLESLIVTDDNGTPDNENDDIDYARGIGGVVNNLNDALRLGEGLVVSMTSVDTYFGIDINNLSTAIFDFNGENGEIITQLFVFSDDWDGDTQIVTASAVPIPSAILLLGGGLLGILGIRRRFNN
jgi:hypothetical protein